MSEEIQFPVDFKCPKCGETKTLCQVACEEQIKRGNIKMGTFVSIRKEATPLVGPTSAIALTVPAIIVHHDICICGFEYVTRVEKVSVPVTMQDRRPPPKLPF